jgi:hypothetical protein
MPYPDKGFHGLVSTISYDPPMLNWIYIDKETLQLKYGTKSSSIDHIVGPWSWTSDKERVTLDDDEPFVAVLEEDGSWGIYCNVYGNGEGLPKDARIFRITLERRPLPAPKAEDE